MPFQNFGARVFVAASVQRDAPADSGVYGLSNAREWILVGETDNIQARLLQHLQELGGRPADEAPTGFSFELCPPGARVARQRRLVRELNPICGSGCNIRAAARRRHLIPLEEHS